MDSLNFNSVETLPNLSARAAFQVNSSAVFKEDVDIVPVIINDTLSYMLWGGDNNMPFDILKLIEDDETFSTCQMFNAEVSFGSGLRYDTCLASASVKSEVNDFFLGNDIASYFLGVCQDFKHFGLAVSVIILSRDDSKIVRLLRKEVCYCRFAPADKDGRITRLLYANWRKMVGIKIKHLVHHLVFYVSENAVYVKRSKFSYFSKFFDSHGAKSEIKAKTDRFGAYFLHFGSVWLLLNTFSLVNVHNDYRVYATEFINLLSVIISIRIKIVPQQETV